LLGVRIKRVDNNAKRLIVEERVVSGGKIKCIETIFVVDIHALIIGRCNKFVALTDIKPGSKVNIDFIKTRDKKMLVKGIAILD